MFRELSIVFYPKFYVVGIDYRTEFIFFYAGYIKANFGFHACAYVCTRV